jgi:large subunit ribosomal protein L22
VRDAHLYGFSLSLEDKNGMKVIASLKNLRISPRKVRLVANSIKGIDVADALVDLDNFMKRSGIPIGKLLKSAIANAENNFGLDKSNLYVYDVQVGEGPTLKRWLPRAFGRATTLRKRSSKINLILEERVEGKNRKTKEQMDKEKKKREEERKKIEKERIEERESENKKTAAAPIADKIIGEKKNTETKSWAKKIFRRKSA